MVKRAGRAFQRQQRGQHAERPHVGIVGFGVVFGDDAAEGCEAGVQVYWAGPVVFEEGVCGAGVHECLEPDALGQEGFCLGEEVAEAGLHC